MAGLPQIHHGLNVADLELTKSILRKLGYTGTQPDAPEPLEFRNIESDPVGQQTAHALGDRYITHYIENPATGHQIDLIEIEPAYIQPRPSRAPAQGDLTIGMHVGDPYEAYELMKRSDPRSSGYSEPVECPEEDGIRFYGLEGQDFIFTRRPDAFAILHYNERDLPEAKRFYEDVLGFELVEVDSPRDDARRYRIEGAGGRLEIEARADVTVPDYEKQSKRYAGANHFRLLNVDMERVSAKVAETGLGGFLLGPYPNGFAFLYGPTNETPEVFDLNVMKRAMEAAGMKAAVPA